MKTLREKIVFPVILLILASYCIALLAVSFTVEIFVEKNIEDTLQRSAMTSAKVLSENGVVASDYIRLMAQMKQSEALIDINYFLYDKNGIPFSLGKYDADLFDLINEELKGVEQGKILPINYKNTSYICLSVPLEEVENKVVSSLVVYGDLTKSHAFINELRRTIFIIMAISAVLGLVMFNRIANDFINSIKHITSWSKRISKGEYITLDDDSNTIELQDLADSLSAMSMELKKHDQSQQTFFQNVSHEFRTPLMSIQGYAEGIQLKVFDDPVNASEVIIEESKRLSKLVNELLYVSRLESEDGKYNLELINCDAFLKKEYVKIQGAAMVAKKNLRLSNECQEMIEIDIDKMARVINNLVSNSLRFAHSEVSIASYAKDGFAYIDVNDDGGGFDPEDLPYVFIRFYKGKQGKYGLGLAIAKMIVESHKGQIMAFNNDKGALVRVKLPIKQKPKNFFDKLTKLH